MYVGIKNNRIEIVSDNFIENKDLTVIKVPQELSHLSAMDILTKCQILNDEIRTKLIKKEVKNLKVALVSNWKMECGIATYAENLWSEVIPHLSDYKLFIEKNDNPISPFNLIKNKKIDDSKILPCWKRGEPLQELINALKEYNPDIIWIQHEFGLWHNARYWLSLMSQLSNYRVIITMHSVFHHKDKTIVEAAMPEIVVHLQGAYDVLKNEKQIPGKVYVIPHGCYPPDNQSKLWNFYKSEQTVIQWGFGFRYKGWENSIKAISFLKKKFPNVFFTGLFSESPYAQHEHDIYYNELLSLINELDLINNVAIIRGFQSEETINSYFKTNQIAVFPYTSNKEHEVFGSSGAVRIAMHKGLPVITSFGNHFADVPSIKADTPEEMSHQLDRLFSNSSLIEEQVKKQNIFLEENSWKKVAEKYIKLFEGNY